ncbi:uncharacterized protein LOC127781170 [Oryza glaberrima]|uniref:uncharacterized protein LOC127781170 n=1 Tax=Oryza glaberrima TaxID=4538 RepID=UPI00224BE7B5|nr:uncharacterized protein LOC127781170 [Oryza glaberrima]
MAFRCSGPPTREGFELESRDKVVRRRAGLREHRGSRSDGHPCRGGSSSSGFGLISATTTTLVVRSYYVTIGTLIDRPAKLSLDDVKRGSGPSTTSLPLCREQEDRNKQE